MYANDIVCTKYNLTRYLIIEKRNKKTYAVKYVLIPKQYMLQLPEIYKLKLHAKLSNLYHIFKTNTFHTLMLIHTINIVNRSIQPN